MFNNDFFILVNGIIFIYLLGYLTISFIAPKTSKKLNLFIGFAYSWLAGNSFLVILLSALFFLKKLNLVTLNNFYLVYLLAVLFFVFQFIRNKLFLKLINNNWLYLLIILIFYIPLITDSLTSFALGWDAIALWFFKAKALFFGDNFLDYAKSNRWLFSSQAYPFGIPLIISSYYRLINYVNDQTIQLYFLFFHLNLTFLIFGTLIKLFGSKLNKLIVLIISLSLLISSNFVIYSHNGYLDLPLSLVLAGIFSSVYWFFDDPDKANKFEWFVMAIILGGLALIIKNEGMPFVVFSLLSLGFLSVKDRIINTWEKWGRHIVVSLASFSPFISWAVYKSVHQIQSFLDGNYFIKFSSLKRLPLIFNYFFMEFLNTNKYNLILIFLILIFVFELSYFVFKGQFKLKDILLVLIFFLQIVSYIYVYMITPLPLVIQIETSLERLIIQIIPVFFLLVAFLFPRKSI